MSTEDKLREALALVSRPRHGRYLSDEEKRVAREALALPQTKLTPALVVHTYRDNHGWRRRSQFYPVDDRFEALAFFISTGKARRAREVEMQRVWVEK